MTELFEFVLLGLGAGAIYGLLGQGLVLIYRGSGILNLAHGAFAMVGAYLYYELRFVEGMAVGISIPITVAAIGLLGAATDQLLLRRLRHASALTRLIATLGVLIVVQSVGVLRYGSDPTLIETLLPREPVDVLGATVSSDRLWLLLAAAVLTVALTCIWRYSRLGWTMSAVSENQRSAAALGISPERISALTWGLGAALAGLAGVLIAPITQLAVGDLTLLTIPALAAALIGGFVSFPLTLLGGVFLGSAESVVNHYVDVTGAARSVPFFVIVAILALRGSSLPLRDYITDRLPVVGSGRIRPEVVAVTVAIGVLLIGFAMSDAWLSSTIVLLGVGIVLLSLVVLTGYSGQLSLAQFALAGIGALVAARLVASADMPFIAALVGGVLMAMLVGLLFALPALRTRGIELAVVTLGLGAAAQALLFRNKEVTLSASGTEVGSPDLFGFDIDSFSHPERYALFALLLFTICAVSVANLRRGRAGRRLLAVRTNERAAAASGISVFQAKLHAFAVAGALAGLGGIVLAFRSTTVVYDQFDPLSSINAVAMAVIGGIGFVVGPLVGGVLATGSIGEELSNSNDSDKYLPLISGLFLLALLIVAPDGITSLAKRLARAAGRIPPLGRLFERSRIRSRSEPVAPLAQPNGQATRVPARRLEVEDLTVRYGGVLAVDSITFSVEPGEIVALIGPNGAGKTSVVDAVSGFVPASGRVLLGGEDIGELAPHQRARAGLVRSFQSLELFEDMTVLENLLAASEERDASAMATDLARPGHPVLSPAARAAVREFELESVLETYPTELSHGHRRLVAIARAVAMEPSVLLLDEPVSGLDSTESVDFAHLVRRLVQEWRPAVLVIEHDMEFVMGLCDRIVVMDFGATIATGSPADIRSDPSAIAAYLGEDEPSTVETLQ